MAMSTRADERGGARAVRVYERATPGLPARSRGLRSLPRARRVK
jgi:hypothetical protein